jgi:hypothetical protein
LIATQAVLAEEQRVAVGRSFRDQVAGDIAVRARVVFDDERLAQQFGELLSTTRAAMSGAPPAGMGTISLIGRDGY